jgi:predicted RNA-binding Zn-ribbon protein involved in translation (DUF1610 family)
MSVNQEDIQMVEVIEHHLDSIVSNLKSITYRVKRANLQRRLEKLKKDKLGLLKLRFRFALGALADYPNLWIDFKGLCYITNAEEKHHKQLHRWLNGEVKKGYFEAGKTYYTFKKHPKKRPYILNEPGLKVTKHGLICAGIDKPFLVVSWAKPKSRLLRRVYRFKTEFSGENLPFELNYLAHSMPLLCEKLPLSLLQNAINGAGSFGKAITFHIKSGRFKRFREELATLEFNILHAMQQKPFLEFGELMLKEILEIFPRLEELMVKCGIKKLNPFKVQTVEQEKYVEDFKSSLLAVIEKPNYEFYTEQYIYRELLMSIDHLRPHLTPYKKKYYVSCPMCGYEVSSQSSEEVAKFFKEFRCDLCSFEIPKGLEFYQCKKCGDFSVPVTNRAKEIGKTFCIRCGQFSEPV